MFLLSNCREPSRYIRELSEIAGDNLRFESVDGAPKQQYPTCRAGHLVERTGPANRRFLGCSQFPNCNHAAQLK
ncbi:topoisomerase DNA-binding C4 zinc finger domain-containing protein [Breoghania corrubedonensis]|uniref:topoisomerase DNA-binding C4 zinc finger domain-containing protein n=1 Tax=Breoghania corrubedonensis TaxID=665038 RepID=UPI002481BD5C|nr:topoisomerase DNA-binding C4 zinc finger domain-containing protein [Breoghania corrubedonensis]